MKTHEEYVAIIASEGLAVNPNKADGTPKNWKTLERDIRKAQHPESYGKTTRGPRGVVVDDVNIERVQERFPDAAIGDRIVLAKDEAGNDTLELRKPAVYNAKPKREQILEMLGL